jgi:hypothetical protein
MNKAQFHVTYGSVVSVVALVALDAVLVEERLAMVEGVDDRKPRDEANDEDAD